MIYLRQWLKSIYRIAVKSSTERTVMDMCSDTDEEVRLLGTALYEALRKKLSVYEKTWVDRIEKLRKELSISQTEISIVDFGAGEPNLDLSEEKYVPRSKNNSVCWRYL